MGELEGVSLDGFGERAVMDSGYDYGQQAQARTQKSKTREGVLMMKLINPGGPCGKRPS